MRRRTRYGEEWYDAVKAYIRENLTYAQHFLEEQIPQVKAVKPEGTYLLWVDFRSLGLSRKELEELIVKKAGLWLDSGDIFGAAGRGFERINVACPRSVLTEALERLARVVQGKRTDRVQIGTTYEKWGAKAPHFCYVKYSS